MIISSEITGKTYKTVDECLAAEKAFIEKKEAKEKATKELEAKKNEAYKKAIAACDEYLKLCGVEVEFGDHGYTMKYHSDGSLADAIFEDILNTMLKQKGAKVVNINKNKLLTLKIRLHKLQTNGKNIDSLGVIGKIERKIRQIEQN